MIRFRSSDVAISAGGVHCGILEESEYALPPSEHASWIPVARKTV
jgi:hypothetical protein